MVKATKEKLSVRIESMTRQQYHRVVVIQNESLWEEVLTFDKLKTMLNNKENNGNNRILGIVAINQTGSCKRSAIGFALFQQRPADSVIFLLDLVVQEKYQHKGVGSKLLEHIVKYHLKEIPGALPILRKHVHQDNLPALHFLWQNLFVAIPQGPKRKPISFIRNNAYVMEYRHFKSREVLPF